MQVFTKEHIVQPTVFDQVLAMLGGVVLYAGSAATAAYLLFQFLGKKWIENKFSQRLEAFKHLQSVELARLKVEIESMLSGALKLQEREFTVLPEMWEKLSDATGAPTLFRLTTRTAQNCASRM
jgi:hypothetical protein